MKPASRSLCRRGNLPRLLSVLLLGLLPALSWAQPATSLIAVNTTRAAAAPAAVRPAERTAPAAAAVVTTFRAIRTAQGNALSWEAPEKPAARFQVERSTDGVNFQVISVVPAHAPGAAAAGYQFLDATPAPEGAYYRLRRGADVSATVPARAGADGWEVTPNPAADWLSCGPATGDYCIRDAARRTVLSGHLGVGQRIDLRRLRNGSYTLELRNGAAHSTHAFVKYTP